LFSPPPIIKAICGFDAKFDEFFGWPIHLSTYVETNKKKFKNSDFCSQVSADLIEMFPYFVGGEPPANLKFEI
jgi:hypothetical protein